MAQITVRIDEQLDRDLKTHARATGSSVNGFVVAVLRAAVDPELEDSESARTRARLARAGLLSEPGPREMPSRPAPARLSRARRAAAGGTPLSELVRTGRG